MSGLARAEAVLRAACGDRVRTDFPLAPLTTFRIGGPAALYLEPESESDLAAAARAIAAGDLEFAVLGKGSNVLIADRGFDGLVLRLGRGFRWAGREGERIVAGGSMPLPALAGVALRHGLDGLAFGVAIPATLGGAVRMNAGAHGDEIAGVVETVDAFRLLGSRAERLDAVAMDFTYRGSGLLADAVVIGATLHLRPGEPSAIRASMADAREWRRRTQPLAEPNCGSVFRNPPGDHAARLIEEAGLKGTRVGAAEISGKHANFIVANPGSSAGDVRALIAAIADAVQERTGVVLVPEVQMIGGHQHVDR
jgi:UDP-N-acetylmuramate dehydrogenase